MIALLPLDLSIEFYLSSAWHDLISYRYERDPINIVHGRKDEISDPVPSTCGMTLDARDGDLSPDNPLGAYYGSIGRNNPLRVTNNVSGDSFGRTVANGWGTGDTDDTWTVLGTASKYSVGSGVGKHSTNRGESLVSYLGGVTFRDVDVSCTVSLPVSDITGDIVWPGDILLRGQDASNYIYCGVAIEVDQSVTIDLYDFVAADFVPISDDLVTVPGLTFSGQTLAVRAQVEAETVRVKVWPAADDEPYGWHAAGRTENFHSAGWVGVQSAVNTDNSNTQPLVFSYDSVTVRLPLFAGEVASWPQSWDLSGIDVTTSIEAAGLRRRLSQGRSALDSTLKRGNTTLAPLPVAYWPCEDGKDATTLASALGGPPMLLTGDTDLASYTTFDASAAIPTTKAGSWIGTVPSYAATGEIQERWIMHAPSSEVVDLGLIAQLQTTGTSGNWEVKYRTGGLLSLEVWAAGTQILDTGALGFDVLDKDILVSLELTQNGSDVDWNLATLEVAQQAGGVISGTVSSVTLGSASRVIITPYQEVADLPLGHIVIRSEVTSLFDLADELNAFAGERAAYRLSRLCLQEGVDFGLAGDPDTTAPMGPQRPLKLIDLLNECADVDRGTLYEAKGVLGLQYRALSALYNQEPVFTLDYSGGQVSDPFQPVIDDQLTRNDITVSRVNGGSYRAVLSEGPMSVLPPEQGGAGRYDDSVSVNAANDGQLADIAGWLLHLGTVAETRYPSVGVDLRNHYITDDTALARAVRDLGVDDRFDITNPKAGQTPNDITQLARGYSLRIGVFDYFLTINSAPASPYTVIELDADDARYDTDGSDLHADITSTATSFTVDVPSGPLWTTAVGDLPLAITVGGERMSVGAVSGASSPQTFSTVTRSLNGIVKAHDAGTAIEITDLAVWAL